MNLYDVAGYDRPLMLSDEHAEAIGATLRNAPTVVPSGRAPKAEWIEYATGLGGDPTVLDTMTRADLIAQYGG